MEAAAVPGLTLAVFNKEETLFSKAFGIKSLQGAEEPVDEQSLFCAASLGKPVFTYLVLQLVDQGVLELDRPLYLYWPHPDLTYDERHKLINTRMVLEHTTGLPNWRMGSRLEFLNDPGEEHTYSGEGFLYLMNIVEKETGKSIKELSQELIFDPLKMPNSSFTWREDFEENYAFAHNEKGQVMARYKPQEPNTAYSLQTTAADYAQLMRALLNGTGLKKETFESVFHPAIELARSPVDDSSISWGLGIGLLQMGDHDYCWQWGGHNWFASLTMALIEEGLGMVYFSNSINGFGLGKHLIELCLGKDRTPHQWLGDYDYLAPVKQLTLSLLQNYDFEASIAPYLATHGRHQDPDLLSEDQMEKIGLLFHEYAERRLSQKIFAYNQAAHPESAKAAENYAIACNICGEQQKAAKYFALAHRLDPDQQMNHDRYLQLTGQHPGKLVFRVEGHNYASYINLAGEFNDWNPVSHPFSRQAGEWRCCIDIPPGKYEYKIIIDGIWTLDASNPKSVYREQHNSVIEVND